MSDLQQNNDLNTSSDDKKKTKKREDVFANIQILNEPARKLPAVIDEALKENIPVVLVKNGYYIGGFYGLNKDTDKEGFAFCQETTEEGSLVFFDQKNGRHLIKTFADLVRFNNTIWNAFFKTSEDYKKPSMLWFNYMLEYDVLSITPGSTR